MARKTYKHPITKLMPHQIFVFGSNTEGRHGMGSALWARNNAGAEYRNPKGLQGKSYAIVTKDLTKKKHPSINPFEMANQVYTLYKYAENNPEKDFLIAWRDAPNLNGYSPKTMAGFFHPNTVHGNKIPDNIIFEESFLILVRDGDTTI